MTAIGNHPSLSGMYLSSCRNILNEEIENSAWLCLLIHSSVMWMYSQIYSLVSAVVNQLFSSMRLYSTWMPTVVLAWRASLLVGYLFPWAQLSVSRFHWLGFSVPLDFSFLFQVFLFCPGNQVSSFLSYYILFRLWFMYPFLCFSMLFLGLGHRDLGPCLTKVISYNSESTSEDCLPL